MLNGKLYALVNTPDANIKGDTGTLTTTVIPAPTQSNQSLDIGDVITKSDKSQPTRATRSPRQPVSTPIIPAPDATSPMEESETELFPLLPTTPASAPETKQPNIPAVEDVDSSVVDRLEEERAAAQKEMDDSLAKLAKLAIEQKKIDATLALVRKIKSPSARAKTLSDLATYIAHDPNFKYEAQVLFKEATVATLALDELELEALPELKELTTITAAKINTPVAPVQTPPTIPPPHVATPTPTVPDDATLTIPEQIDATPKPLSSTPSVPSRPSLTPPKLTVTPTPPTVIDPPTTPPASAPATDANPDTKTNVPQKRRAMPSIAPPATPSAPAGIAPPKLTDEEQDEDDLTLEPKRSK
jgi:hypothetical protein